MPSLKSLVSLEVLLCVLESADEAVLSSLGLPFFLGNDG